MFCRGVESGSAAGWLAVVSSLLRQWAFVVVLETVFVSVVT